MPHTSATDWVHWLLGLAVVWAVPTLGPATDGGTAPAGPATAGAVAPVAPAAPLDGPAIVAHRGASGGAPENTLAAADAAAELGAVWVETDVQRTADGELILLHDTTLGRTTDVEEVFPDRAPWNVSDFTAEEIARLDAGSWFGEEFAGEAVPTLADFLDRLAANGQRLLLEMKEPELYPGIEEEILDVLADEGWLREARPGDRLVVQSFDAASVRTVHELAPDVATGFIGNPAVADIAEHAAFADQINPRVSELTADYVAELQSVDGPHGEPVRVQTWTVNDGPTAERVTGLGVDGVITNHPELIREALEAR
ncbi:glycerophosphodiester phosphodiesterase [Streptomyces sp. NBC_01803]|uniref:glycerophosphodiester phosphodiesterase n=1 Tax=Streptomyces sp. NBC_01803 TaxID=2975946 RepID=UPI002DDABE75|nr:glycerophosphodiester phosphodiesterase family protein [Streptomyces sp. NBC_01803]WSA46746.1 glycerophosphodiester phosphodiesterase family protein [Streptomyces sp. NBC_01803]